MKYFKLAFLQNSELDRKEAAAVRKAAKQGDAESQHRLAGHLYMQDDEACVDWLRKAVKQDYALAMNDLAVLMFGGLFLPKDVKYGVQLLREAAERQCSYALLNLFFCNMEGFGMPRNRARAMQHLQQAVDLENAEAIRELAWCYRDGYGVKKSVEKCKLLNLQAAQMGVPAAMREYSRLLLDKRDKENFDPKEGVMWMLKAADGEDYEAMYDLALCHALGLYGFEQDKKKTTYWFLRAASLDPISTTLDDSLNEFELYLLEEFSDVDDDDFDVNAIEEYLDAEMIEEYMKLNTLP